MKGHGKKKSVWRGPIDGPWPRVQVNGELENAEREWIATNDLGVYASSTVALMHTRRHHGLLVTPLEPGGPRYVILSHLEMTLETGGRAYHLATHQFPSVAPTPGYRFMDTFSQDPLPRWVFRFPGGKVERTVSLVRGHHAVAVAFNWSGPEPARLTLRPLMPMRREDALCREHGAMLQEVVLRAGEVEVRPVQDLPAVRFRHSGVFMGSPDWWRRFEYLDDRGRYTDFQEDMWSPGVFELELTPNQTTYLVASIGVPPGGAPADLVLEAARHQLAQDPGENAPPGVRALAVAVESFAREGGIVAGYPWHDVWSRDLLLALPGVYLCRQRLADAVTALKQLLSAGVGPLLPERLTGESRACLDASLWLFLTGQRVLDALSAEERQAVLLPLFRRCRGIYEWIVEGADRVCLSDSGLVIAFGPGPVTWMDAVVGGQPVTPRQGVAVEIQALWISACERLAEWATELGDLPLSDDAAARAAACRQAFRRAFWCDETNFPYDRISSEHSTLTSWTDRAIRPGALIALAIQPELFDSVQRREVLARTTESLLTKRGIRTLDPMDPRYLGSAGGTIEDRLLAAHQGSAWPHLLLFYVRAMLGEYPERAPDLVRLLDDALLECRALGFVAQMVDGDEPHRWRGSPAYAVANAMLLEALVSELGLGPAVAAE